MAARTVILDCDPGVDDAVALLMALASPGELHLPGITTVAGNVPLELTTRNALALLALAGRRIPVFAGAARPLVRPLATAEHVHGDSGLGGLVLPEPAETAEDLPAAQFITEMAEAGGGEVILAPTGPLTNIALALRAVPDVAGIVLMGGAAGAGNITPHAEFNIYVDPDGAAEVFASGAPITMIGLDVTRQVMITPARLAAIGAVGTAAAAAVATMLGTYPAGAPLHDPCVIAYLLRPDLFAGRAARVTVETADEETLGRTLVDWQAPPGACNATVIKTVDSDGLFALLMECLGRI